MSVLFTLLMLASIVCLIIGLASPTTFSKVFKKNATRGKLALIFGGAFILFIILIGITAPKTDQPNKEQTATETAKTLTPEEQAKKDADDAVAKKLADEARAKQEAEAKAQAEAKAEAEKELDAEVRFSDVAFMIKNKEAKDWSNCKFVLNGKVFGSDYTYKTSEGIVANDSIIVAMREFTKGDGTRFDPYSTKAKNLFLSCDVGANHRTGYYTISE